MSETITLADDFNPFDDTIVAQPPVEAPVETTDPIDPPQETPPAPTTTETQFDYNSFVKENFGYDSVDAAKEEIQKLKSKPVFANSLFTAGIGPRPMVAGWQPATAQPTR